jgi:hypothetical protein
MDITTLFDNDSPDLQPFIDNNQVGRTWEGTSKTWTIAEVSIEREHTINPFTGSLQTRVVLSLDDGVEVITPPARAGLP